MQMQQIALLFPMLSGSCLIQWGAACDSVVERHDPDFRISAYILSISPEDGCFPSGFSTSLNQSRQVDCETPVLFAIQARRDHRLEPSSNGVFSYLAL